MRYITITSPVSSFAEAVRQDSARTREANLAIAASERQVARHTAQWRADEALHRAEQVARNAKGKEARKEARKALAHAQSVFNMAINPKFFL